jgi:hypothetical protein
MTPPQAILCIPGDWVDQRALVERIVHASDGYLFAGRVLLHMDSGDAFELAFEPADPRVTTAFGYAGAHWNGTADMDRIGAHASVVYLIGTGGSRAHAERLMLAGAALLKAGGLGVKVESSGIAHSPRAWHDFVASRHLFSAHDAFVLYLRGAQVYSCGMHHFGLPEATVDLVDSDDAPELLRAFTRYLFSENPTILAGQTFATSKNAPVYRVVTGTPMDDEPGSLFRNSYGTWRLEGVQENPRLKETGKWWQGLLH